MSLAAVLAVVAAAAQHVQSPRVCNSRVLCRMHVVSLGSHQHFLFPFSIFQSMVSAGVPPERKNLSFLGWVFYCNSFLCHGIKREKRDSEPKTLPAFDCNHYNESYRTSQSGDCASGLFICV